MSIGAEATVQGNVMKILSEKLQIDCQDPELDLIDAGVLDSLKFVDLMLHLEEAFGIVIALESVEFDRFRSIKRISEYVASAGLAQAQQGSVVAAQHQSIQ